ncbi:MAG: helix-hairpin-helix domain-containing protein [Alloprevotella sp.]|nr:helix-hairpin-helix domain-containing protein [Alloprevotella sp.]
MLRPRLLTLPCALLLALLPVRVAAQEHWISWDEFCETFSARLEDEEEEAAEDWLTRLEDIAAAPMNINTATREDLLRLPFLSEGQADSLIAYRERKKGILDLGELMFVRNLSLSDRRYLSLFTYAGSTAQAQPTLRELLTAGRHTAEGNLDIPLYRRAGNRTYTEAELQANRNRAYLGNGLASTVRYRYDYRHSLRYGLTLEKDAGEPFACKGFYPFDHTSLYVAYKPAGGNWEAVVGDYRLHWGQGLLLGNAFIASPALLLEAPRRTNTAFSPHTSTEESAFFRGAAGGVRIGKYWRLAAFVSYRRLDARLVGDTIRSLLATGLHRTEQEINRRGNAGCFTAGARVAYERSDWAVGIGGYAATYSRHIAPDPRDYNRYYLRGRNAMGISADWRVRFARQWTITGEAAADRRLHLALTQTLAWMPADDLRLTLHHRHFSRRFVAPFAKPIQAGNRTANEHGVMLGGKFTGIKRTELRAYADYFRFPAPTYLATGPSDGIEVLAEGKYFATKRWELLLRYKTRSRQRNLTGYLGFMEYATTHRLRLQATWRTERTSVAAALDGCIADRQATAAAYGWMASARMGIQPSEKLSLRASAAVFFTDDYAAALYAYEPQLRSTFAFPASYYHGCRAAAVLRWQPTRGIGLGLRYALLHFFNRSSIGSGTQEISSPTKQDISIQATFSFR